MNIIIRQIESPFRHGSFCVMSHECNKCLASEKAHKMENILSRLTSALVARQLFSATQIMTIDNQINMDAIGKGTYHSHVLCMF